MQREPGDQHHGIIPSQGMRVLLEGHPSRHAAEYTSSHQCVPTRRFKRWEELLSARYSSLCVVLQQNQSFSLLFPFWGPFLMLMIPISTPAKSHRTKLTHWNGRLILWFSLCICHRLTQSPSVSCLVFLQNEDKCLTLYIGIGVAGRWLWISYWHKIRVLRWQQQHFKTSLPTVFGARWAM